MFPLVKNLYNFYVSQTRILPLLKNSITSESKIEAPGNIPSSSTSSASSSNQTDSNNAIAWFFGTFVISNNGSTQISKPFPRLTHQIEEIKNKCTERWIKLALASPKKNLCQLREFINISIKEKFAKFSKEDLPKALQSITLEQLVDLFADTNIFCGPSDSVAEKSPIDEAIRKEVNNRPERLLQNLTQLQSESNQPLALKAVTETLQALGKYATQDTVEKLVVGFYKHINENLALLNLDALRELKQLLPVLEGLLKSYSAKSSSGDLPKTWVVACLQAECNAAAQDFSNALIQAEANSMIKAISRLAIYHKELITVSENYCEPIDEKYESITKIITPIFESLEKEKKIALTNMLASENIKELKRTATCASQDLANKDFVEKSKLFKALVDSLEAAESEASASTLKLDWFVYAKVKFSQLLEYFKPLSAFKPYIDSIQKEFGVLLIPQEASGYKYQVTAGRVSDNFYKYYQNKFNEDYEKFFKKDEHGKYEYEKNSIAIPNIDVSISEQASKDWNRNGAKNITIGSFASTNYFKVLQDEESEQPALYCAASALQSFCGKNEKEIFAISECLSQGTAIIMPHLYMLPEEGRAPIITLPGGEIISTFSVGKDGSADYTLNFNVSRQIDGKARIEFTHTLGNKSGVENESEKYKRKNIQSVMPFNPAGDSDPIHMKPESFIEVKANLIVDAEGKVTVEEGISYEYALIPAEDPIQ